MSTPPVSALAVPVASPPPPPPSATFARSGGSGALHISGGGGHHSRSAATSAAAAAAMSAANASGAGTGVLLAAPDAQAHSSADRPHGHADGHDREVVVASSGGAAAGAGASEMDDGIAAGGRGGVLLAGPNAQAHPSAAGPHGHTDGSGREVVFASGGGAAAGAGASEMDDGTAAGGAGGGVSVRRSVHRASAAADRSPETGRSDPREVSQGGCCTGDTAKTLLKVGLFVMAVIFVLSLFMCIKHGGQPLLPPPTGMPPIVVPIACALSGVISLYLIAIHCRQAKSVEDGHTHSPKAGHGHGPSSVDETVPLHSPKAGDSSAGHDVKDADGVSGAKK